MGPVIWWVGSVFSGSRVSGRGKAAGDEAGKAAWEKGERGRVQGG